jgi:hypothetical protein
MSLCNYIKDEQGMIIYLDMSMEMSKNQDLPVQADVPEVPLVKDDKPEEKPRVFDIEKGWKEQLTLEEIERIKNWGRKSGKTVA